MLARCSGRSAVLCRLDESRPSREPDAKARFRKLDKKSSTRIRLTSGFRVMASSSSPHKAGRKSKPGKPVQSLDRPLSSRTKKPRVIVIRQEGPVLPLSLLVTDHLRHPGG